MPTLALLVFLSCNKSATDADSAATACPAPGMAMARAVLPDDDLPGEVAVGRPGDLLLRNRQAAYVITAPDAGSTYYHYGGIVADALPMQGCAPAGDDKLDEVGLVIGRLDLLSRSDSVLRAFRAESVEVLADGADGGPAIVRARGVDDTYWLVEYTLIRDAADDGGRPLSGPLGVELVVDYILQPDSPVLRVELGVTNVGEAPLQLMSAALLSFGGTLDLYGYASTRVSALGLDLGMGLPWLVATDGEGALAWAVEEGNLANIGVSGVDVALDANQALSEPIELDPGETETRVMFLNVGAGDGPSATTPLALVNPEPMDGKPFTLATARGRVVDPSGQGVAGARVSIQARAPDAEWGVLDLAVTDAAGDFTAPLLVLDEAWSWRLVAEAEGRHGSEAVEVSPGDEGLRLEVSGAGALDFTLVDGAGQPSPARLALDELDTGARVDLWLAGAGRAAVPPGRYQVVATRGYEFAPVTAELEIPEGGAASLDLVMQAVVDTSGFVSIDTHVHSWDSPDSRVAPVDVLLHAAAHGLDVVVHTEHEHIVDRATLPRDAGLDAWVTSIGGEEVTATVPEHLTMFPATPDGSPRGGIVEWYGRDIAELFALMRERSGGGVNLLNHPSYLDLVGWDRLLAEPTLADPTLLGLAPDAALWSWDLDGIEVMNGHGDPFDSGNGRWSAWQSMLNAGHRVVPVGCSDDHGGDEVGFPRSYVPSSTDRPDQVDTDEVVAAFRGGRLIASAGAFARVALGEGVGPGDLLTVNEGEVPLSIHVEALPEVDVRYISVFVNCEEVLTLPADDPDGVVKHSEVLTLPLPADEDAQVTLAAFGARRLPAGMPQYDPRRVPRVLTGAVFVDTDGDGAFTAPGGRECVALLQDPTGG